nr:hypothetical protein [Tanacetum cinerariifolium]
KANNKVVLALTSFLLFCMSSVVTATVLPFFVAVPSLDEPDWDFGKGRVLLIHFLQSSQQWHLFSLAGGTFFTNSGNSSGSGNSSLAVGMPCAFYSQHVCTNAPV